MRLQEFLDPDSITVNLTGATKDEVIDGMVGLLRLDPGASQSLARLVRRREHLGSTGFGRGIAIPHARSLIVNRLRVAFGRHPLGVEYSAMDQLPVHALFLVVAPPHEVSNQYLPILGKVAQLCQEPGILARLTSVRTVAEICEILDRHDR